MSQPTSYEEICKEFGFDPRELYPIPKHYYVGIVDADLGTQWPVEVSDSFADLESQGNRFAKILQLTDPESIVERNQKLIQSAWQKERVAKEFKARLKKHYSLVISNEYFELCYQETLRTNSPDDDWFLDTLKARIDFALTVLKPV